MASVHHHCDRVAFACRNHDVKARSNAALSRAMGGKGIIVSSGARSVWEMRAPHDVINLATLFGLNQQQAKVHTALHLCLSAEICLAKFQAGQYSQAFGGA